MDVESAGKLKKERTEAQKAATAKAQEASRLSREAGPQEYTAPPDDGASTLLQDMRHVYLNPKCYDETLSHKHTREYLKRSPEKFRAQMALLEKQHREKVQEKKVGVEKDEGVERCMELIEEWLKENKDA